MKTVAVLCFISLAAICVGQEHAPTLEQCKADLALWYDKDGALDYLKAQGMRMSDGIKNTSSYNRLTLKLITFRINEMVKCSSVSGKDGGYADAVDFYSGLRRDRYYWFLVRHHLMGQLEKEDEKGVR